MIDLHQDFFPHLDYPELFRHGGQTGFELVEAAGVRTLVATSWKKPPGLDLFHATVPALQAAAFADDARRIGDRDSWCVVTDAQGLDDVVTAGHRVGVILHVEGLNVWPRSGFDALEGWRSVGWRSVGPVWHRSNWFGGGTGDAEQGLTPAGRRFVAWLARRGLVLDFAHMSDRTFWEAAAVWSKPIVVSHANAREVAETPRNLSADQLRAVAASGGVVGVSFATSMVGPDADLDRVCDHVLRMIEAMGLEHVGLGTDFGGIGGPVIEGLEDVACLPNLLDALADRGLTGDELGAITWRNAHRVLRTLLATSGSTQCRPLNPCSPGSDRVPASHVEVSS